MLNDHAHANAALESLGIDPNTVLAHGADASGYLVLGRHQDGVVMMTADGPEMSRVPWSSRDAWFRFQEADLLDAEAALPRRVQLSRAKGWRKPANTVVVARPSRWGNPFRVARGTVFGLPWGEIRDYPIGTRFPKRDEYAAYITSSSHTAAVEHAVDLFRTYLEVTRRDAPEEFEAWIAPLRGHNLACWCPLDDPCHADVLIELANGGAP